MGLWTITSHFGVVTLEYTLGEGILHGVLLEGPLLDCTVRRVELDSIPTANWSAAHVDMHSVAWTKRRPSSKLCLLTSVSLLTKFVGLWWTSRFSGSYRFSRVPVSHFDVVSMVLPPSLVGCSNQSGVFWAGMQMSPCDQMLHGLP